MVVKNIHRELRCCKSSLNFNCFCTSLF